jgi:hypothetical protein
MASIAQIIRNMRMDHLNAAGIANADAAPPPKSVAQDVAAALSFAPAARVDGF